MTAEERLKAAFLAHAAAKTPAAKEAARLAALEALGEIVEERDRARASA